MVFGTNFINNDVKVAFQGYCKYPTVDSSVKASGFSSCANSIRNLDDVDNKWYVQWLVTRFVLNRFSLLKSEKDFHKDGE